MKILEAVIPAAGFGTRFLPLTKAVPKELVPLGNKPAIHYIMDEIAKANLAKAIIITNPFKQAIKNYFTVNKELEEFLVQKNKQSLMHELNTLMQKLQFEYIYQHQAKGLGHAINCAATSIASDFFAVLLPDDIIFNPIPEIGNLMNLAISHHASIIAVQEITDESIGSYGVIDINEQINDDCFLVKNIVEKPKPRQAPSRFAVIGRYILSKKILPFLDKAPPGAGGEIQLTDGIQAFINSGKPVIAYKISGKRFDVGTPVGWFGANKILFG